MHSATLLIFAAVLAGSTARYLSSNGMCKYYRDLPDNKKVNCGQGGISIPECLAKGCCFDDGEDDAPVKWGVPFCYIQNVTKSDKCPLIRTPNQRVCGQSANAYNCAMLQCCFVDGVCLTAPADNTPGYVQNTPSSVPGLTGGLVAPSNGIPKSGSLPASFGGAGDKQIYTDNYGNRYYVNGDGHQIYLAPESQQSTPPTQPPSSSNNVYYHEGEPYTIDQYGNKVYVNQQSQQAQPPQQQQQYCSATAQLCYLGYTQPVEKSVCEARGCCVAYDRTCRKRQGALGTSVPSSYQPQQQQQQQYPPQQQPQPYQPQQSLPTSGGGSDSGEDIAGLGSRCNLAASIQNLKLKQEYQTKFKCTGLETTVSKEAADKAVKDILGGLLPSGSGGIGGQQERPTGPIGAYQPNYGSGNRPSIGNSKICELIKSQDSMGSFGNMLARQYGCPSTSKYGNIFGNIPFDVFAALLGLDEEDEDEEKKGAIDPAKIPYLIRDSCLEKRYNYRACTIGINVNIYTAAECYNIGCVFSPSDKLCFRCPKVPASAYILQDSAETCRVDGDKESCPGYQNFLMTTLFSGQGGANGGLSSMLPLISLLGGEDDGGLDTKNLALLSMLGGQGGAGGAGGAGGMQSMLPLLLASKGSGSGSSSSSLATMMALGGLGGLGGAGGAGGAGALSNPLLYSLIGRSGQTSPAQRNLDLSSLLGAGGGGSNPLLSMLGGGGGGANPLLSMLGGGGGGGSNSALLSLLGGGGGAGSNPLLNSLIGGNSEANDQAAQQRRFYCERKGCCWKEGGTFGGTCHAKGYTFEKDCIPKPDSGSCGKAGTGIIARLINADSVNSNKHRPWMALIKKAGSAEVRCGGVLICSQWIMTAASCLTKVTSASNSQIDLPNLNSNTLDVYIGSISASSPLNSGEKVSVEKIIPHPRFNFQQTLNDIALLKIRSFAFSNTRRPACLPALRSKGPENGNTLYMTGYGATASMPESNLNELRFVVKSIEHCRSKYPGANLQFGVFCANAPVDGADSCYGDGGSPALSYDSDNDAWTVVGINYGGTDDCSGSKPSLFTDISTFIGWIAQTTNGCCSLPGSRNF